MNKVHRLNTTSQNLLHEKLDFMQAVQTAGVLNLPYRQVSTQSPLQHEDEVDRGRGSVGMIKFSSDEQSPVMNKATRNPVLTLNATRPRCCVDCRCQCHQHTSFRSPTYLDHIFGRLFLGYRASGWLRQPCNEPNCGLRAKQIMLVYTFPSWFMHNVVFATLWSGRVKGPELVIRMMNLREGWELFSWFHLTEERPIVSEVQRQLEEGESSILDVTVSGCTLLHVSCA